MQPVTKAMAVSDDEDDLESLRLAALQSLKRPPVNPSNSSTSAASVQVASKVCNPTGFNSSKNVNKRGRAFHGGGRTARNGTFNNRIRNSNLISVPTIEPEQSNESSADTNRNKKFADDKSVPKLILPQDRYCNIKVSKENKVFEGTSKFDRYNNSDNSDSDSESEDEKTSGMESPKKLERANSLEKLMQELENEIQGELKPSTDLTTKPKAKVRKSRKSKEIADPEISLLESSDELCTGENEPKTKLISEKSEPNSDKSETSVNNGKSESAKVVDLPARTEAQDVPVRRKSKSPVKPPVLPNTRRPPIETCLPRNPVVNQPIPNLPYINPNVPVATPLLPPFQTNPYPNYNVPLGHAIPFDHQPLPYNFSNIPPHMGHPNGINSPPQQMFSPNRYERPISPLTIKTDILNTISAPLSPRSAAFVLQNREIIERRKKSPRRSYSRSPSPEFRRSMSPRYRRSNSRSPRSPSRQRLSPNRRISPPRRASPNNRRMSPNMRRLSPGSQPSSRRSSPSNNRYRTSPKRSSPTGQMSPKRSRRSPQRSNIRNRLGTQPVPNQPEVTVEDNQTERKTRKRSRSISLSLSPSPERYTTTNSPLNKGNEQNNQSVNPVLEARRRKFEANVPTEGIIRLKPKMDDEEDEELLEGDNGENQKNEVPMDPNEDEALKEDELLGGEDTYIDFNVRVDDLFSDEESDDNENEGRFKSNRQQTSHAVTVLPFTQLINGSSTNVKNEAPLTEKRQYDRDRKQRSRFERGDRNRSDKDKSTASGGKSTPERNRYKEERDREKPRNRLNERHRSRSPIRSQTRDSVINSTAETKHKSDDADKSNSSLSSSKSNSDNTRKESGTPEKRPLKSLMSLKVDIKSDRKKPPIVSPIENKKIEIKIRNPAKYEVESRNLDSNKSKADDAVKEKKTSARKVEVANDTVINGTENEEFEEPDPEVIVDNEEDDDDDIVNKNEGAGDLRAQLSRKRAERQNKLPKVEGVPSRLLQNALQGAVFKKSKKSKSKKKEKETAPVDDVDASVYAAIRRTTAKNGYGVADINCNTASKERKVRVLHCDAETLPIASDGKLPIHLRLGIPGNMDIFTDTKSHKKTSRKRSKNKGNFDQV